MSIERVFWSGAGRLRLGWRLLAFLAVAVAIGGVLGPLGPGGMVWGATVLLVSTTCSGWILLALDGRRPAALGFHFSPEALREAGKGLALGVALGLAVVLVMVGAGGLRWTPEAGRPLTWLTGALAALALLAVPAAAEEALLRGYPLQAMGEVWGAGLAIVVTGVLFGLLHLTNPGVGVVSTFNVAAAGVLLGVVYVRTLSLWWATGVHVGWNWAHGYLADVPVSGLDLMDAPFYDGVPQGPEWLGGGPFGPEGSFAATLVLIAAASALWWGPWLRPGRAAADAGGLLGNAGPPSGVHRTAAADGPSGGAADGPSEGAVDGTGGGPIERTRAVGGASRPKRNADEGRTNE